MSSYVGVVVSDPWLHSQFTQVELRTLKSKFNSNKTLLERFTVGELPPLVAPLMRMRSNLYWTSLMPILLIKKSISRLSSGRI